MTNRFLSNEDLAYWAIDSTPFLAVMSTMASFAGECQVSDLSSKLHWILSDSEDSSQLSGSFELRRLTHWLHRGGFQSSCKVSYRPLQSMEISLCGSKYLARFFDTLRKSFPYRAPYFSRPTWQCWQMSSLSYLTRTKSWNCSLWHLCSELYPAGALLFSLCKLVHLR